MPPEGHTVADCPQQPTLTHLVQLGERTASALEQIAEQGAMVMSHEKRLDKMDLNVNELYSRVRKVELKHAEEAGIEKVEDVRTKFWTEVKLRLLPSVLAGIFFLCWVFDKWGVVEKIVNLWNEMKG